MRWVALVSPTANGVGCVVGQGIPRDKPLFPVKYRLTVAADEVEEICKVSASVPTVNVPLDP